MAERRFVEILIEGLDYQNSAVDWPGSGASAPGFDYTNKATYLDFTGLNDAQRTAVLKHTNYMPLFQFTYSNAVLKSTKNGVVQADQAITPAWDGQAQNVYFIDVDGWRDRYVRMPQGANVDILRVESTGQTRFLQQDNDDALGSDVTTALQTTSSFNTTNDVFEAPRGAWTTVRSSATGELVGRYQEFSEVFYDQITSDFYFPSDGYQGGIEPHAPKEDGRATWATSYVGDTGIKTYDLDARADALPSTLARDPEWYYTVGNRNLIAFNTDSNGRFSGGTYIANTVEPTPAAQIRAAMETWQLGRYTDRIKAFDTYVDALAFDTSSLQLADSSTVYDQFGFQYKYWDNWERIGRWAKDPQGRGWTGSWDQMYLTYTTIDDSGNFGTVANPYTAQNSSSFNQVVNGGGLNLGYWASPSGNPGHWQYDEIRGTVEYTDNTGKKGGTEYNVYDVWGRREQDKTIKEDYTDYTYEWKSKWKPIYDQRTQQTFKLVTLDKSLYQNLPVEQTTTKQVPKVTFDNVTVWETRPITTTETVLKTVVTTDTAAARAFGEANTSIGGMTVTVNAGGTVSLSGKVQATTTLSVRADDTLRVRSEATTDVYYDHDNDPATPEIIRFAAVPITSSLVGETLSLSAGQLLDVDDTAQITPVQDAASVATASVTLGSDRDIRLGGVVSADTTTTATVSAGRNLDLSATITAGTVVLKSGQSLSKAGGITADAETRVTATTTGITVTSGDVGGDIVLTNATLTAATAGQAITFSAPKGAVEQVLVARTSGGTTQQLPSGLLDADRIVATAATGLTLNTRTDAVTLTVTDIGGLRLHNEGNLEITKAETLDGAIAITNVGHVDARYLVAQGLSDRNDISVRAEARAPSTSANLTVGQFSTGSGTGTVVRRGDVSFLVQGTLTFRDPTKPIQADELELSVAGGLGTLTDPLRTEVNALKLATTTAGNVFVTQGTQSLRLTEVAIANGSFTVNAGGSVDLIDVRSRSNADANDITVTAAGDLLVRYVSAGIYAADANDPVLFDRNGTAIGYTSIKSEGDVSLTSTNGRVYEVFVDDVVDVVADRLTVRAATGVTGLETALNVLDVRTTAGDIEISERDSYLEAYRVRDAQGNPVSDAQNQPVFEFPGLTVARAEITQPRAGQKDDVTITSQKNLRVDAQGLVQGDQVRLVSLEDSISASKPASGDSIVYTRGIGFAAADAVQVYRYFGAPELVEYRAGTFFQFGEGTQSSPYTRKLPQSISADTVILESGGTLTLDGALSANRLLQLVAGEDLILDGTVSIKGSRYDGTSPLVAGMIDQVVLKAQGVRNVYKAFDFTGDNDTNDTVSEAMAGVDFNGDGDYADSISEGSVPQPTGFINIQTNDLPAQEFEIRALLDIYVDLEEPNAPVRDWTLSGYVGGLNGFDPAKNITLRVEGALTVEGGIVAAESTGNTDGLLTVRAASISSDGASVFIARDLVVDTGGSAQLNTLVDTLTLESRVSGDVIVNEATGLVIERMVVNNGRIEVIAGANLYLRDVRNAADQDDIALRSAADIYVDSVEAGTSVGALKTGGMVTVDAKGTVYEWQALKSLFATNTTVTAASANPLQAQVSRLGFDGPATVTNVSAATAVTLGMEFKVGANARALTVGDVYRVQVQGNTYSETVTTSTTWANLLSGLKTQIEAGLGAGGVTVVVDAGSRTLRVNATSESQAAGVSASIQYGASTSALSASRKQVTALTYEGRELTAGDVYSVQVGGVTYSAPAVTSSTTWTGLLGQLAALIPGKVVSTVPDARKLVIEGTQEFAVSGSVAYAVASGNEYSVQIDNRKYTVVAGANDTWSTLLPALKTRIEAGESGTSTPVNLTVGVDAAARQITLTAGTAGKAFQPSGSIVYGAYDQASADIYGYQVKVLGQTGFEPTASSSTNLTVGTGTKTLTLSSDPGNWVLGQWVSFTSGAMRMSGTVGDYDAGTRTMSLQVLDTAGSGNSASWTVSGKGMVVLTDPTVRGGGSELEVRYIASSGAMATGDTTVTQVGVFATGGGVQSNTQNVSVQAGSASRQVSVVTFPRQIGPGVAYSLSVNGTTYTVEPGQGGLSAGATWTDVLAKFKQLIDAGGIVTAATSAATRELTLTAVAINTPFTMGDLRVALSTSTPVANAVSDAGATPVQQAGTGGLQESDLAFGGASAGATPGATAEVAVVINGNRYATQVGTNVLLEISGIAAEAVRLTSATTALTVGQSRSQDVDFSGLNFTGLTNVTITVGSTPYSVANPVSAATLANAIANLVNPGTATTGYSASVLGGVLTISHASASTVIAAATQTVSGTTSALGTGAVKRFIDLSSLTVQQGLTYAVTIGGDVFRHEVTAATTAAQLAEALAGRIDASASLVATWNGSTIIVSSGAGASTISVAASSSLGQLTISQGSKVGAPTVIDLSDVVVVPGSLYTLTAGSHTAQVTAVGGDTAQTLAGKLETALDLAAASNLSTARTITVADTWAAVLGEIERQIEAGEVMTVTVDATARKLTLSSTSSSDSFTVDAVGVDTAERMSSLGSNPTVAASSGVKQVSELGLAGGVTVATGDKYTLVLTDAAGQVRSYQVAADHRVTTPVEQPTATTTQATSSSSVQIDTLDFGATPDLGATYRVGLLSVVTDTSAGSVTVTQFSHAVQVTSALDTNNNSTVEIGEVLTALANKINAQSGRFVTASQANGKLVLTGTENDREFLSTLSAMPAVFAGEGTRSLDVTFDNFTLSPGQKINLTLGWTYGNTKPGATASYTVQNGDTWTSVLAGLKTSIEALTFNNVQPFAIPGNSTSPITVDVASRKLTITPSDMFVNALEVRALAVFQDKVRTAEEILTQATAAINADTANGLSATYDSSRQVLVIEADAPNAPFGVGGLTLTRASVVSDDGSTPSNTPSVAKQVSRVVFANINLVANQRFSLTLTPAGGTAETYSVDTDASPTWTEVLQSTAAGLSGKINSGAVATATFDATTRTLTLTGKNNNQAFTVSGVDVSNIVSASASAVSGAVTTPSAAGTSATQVSTLVVPGGGAAPVADAEYSATLSGVKHTVKVGDVVNGLTVVNTWSSVLAALEFKLEATGLVNVTRNDGNQTLTMTATQANTAFSASSGKLDTGVGTPTNPLAVPGDYVLIIPDRTPGSFGLAANDSLTIVSLPTTPNAGELINLVAGSNDSGPNDTSDLVIVSPVNVGRNGSGGVTNGGAVQLAASGGVTLGGTVTAENLSVSVGGDLSLTTDVGTMAIVMTRPGDLTVVQTGALNLTSLQVLGGGDVAIVADGNVTIGTITGVAGDITLTSKTGSISIASIASGADVVLSAPAGGVTLGGVVSGNTISTVEMDSLSITAKGAVTVYEKDDLVIGQITSTDKAAVMVVAGGQLTVDGALTAAGANTIALTTTAGDILLNQAITTASGAVTLTSAGDMKLGATGDIITTSGNLVLDSGGTLEMTGETEVNAGSGTLRLEASGQITLGKLRTTNSADLVIQSGAIVDAAEGSIDIIAPAAELVIDAVGGVGTVLNPIEIDVAALDVRNSGGGDIGLVEAGPLTINRVQQSGGGDVSISTVNGKITVAGAVTSGQAMYGRITSYNPSTGQITVAVTDTTGSGSAGSWKIASSGVTGTSGSTLSVATGTVSFTASTSKAWTAGQWIEIVRDEPASDIALYAGGNAGQLAVDESIVSTTGNVDLTVEGGDFLLADVVRGVNVTMIVTRGSLLNAGKITTVNGVSYKDNWRLQPGTSDFDPEIQWLMSRGFYAAEQPTGGVEVAKLQPHIAAQHLPNGTDLRLDYGPFIQATGTGSDGLIRISVQGSIGEAVEGFDLSPGSIMLNGNKLNTSSSDRGAMYMLASDSIEVESLGNSTDAAGSKGGETVLYALNGNLKMQGVIDGNGDQVNLGGYDVDLRAAVRSADGSLTLSNLDKSGTMVFGIAQAGTYSVDQNELGFLQPGFSAINIGDEFSSNQIVFGTTSSTSTIVFKDDVILNNPVIGGKIELNQPVTVAGSLEITGSGFTTYWNRNAPVTTTDTLSLNDSLIITGAVVATAGSDGSGDMYIGGENWHIVNGDGDRVENKFSGNGSVTVFNLNATPSLATFNVRVGGQLLSAAPTRSSARRSR